MKSDVRYPKLKAFNELLSKILEVLCVAWIVLWIVMAVVYVKTGSFLGLPVVFLLASPAAIFLCYRYNLRKKRSAVLSKTQS